MLTRLGLNLSAATVTMVSMPNMGMVLFALVLRRNYNDKDNTIKNNDKSNLGNDDCNNECARDGHNGSN